MTIVRMRSPARPKPNITVRGVRKGAKTPALPKIIRDLLGDLSDLVAQVARIASPSSADRLKIKFIVDAKLLKPDIVGRLRNILSNYALTLQCNIYGQEESTDEQGSTTKRLPDNVTKIVRTLTIGTPPADKAATQLDEIIMYFRRRGQRVTLEYSFKSVFPEGITQYFPDGEIPL